MRLRPPSTRTFAVPLAGFVLALCGFTAPRTARDPRRGAHTRVGDRPHMLTGPGLPTPSARPGAGRRARRKQLKGAPVGLFGSGGRLATASAGHADCAEPTHGTGNGTGTAGKRPSPYSPVEASSRREVATLPLRAMWTSPATLPEWSRTNTSTPGAPDTANVSGAIGISRDGSPPSLT